MTETADVATAVGDAGLHVRPTRRLDRLYHLAEADNLTSILEQGLKSTEQLLDLVGMSPLERAVLLRTHRPDHVRLSESVRIRDQRPMPPAALARALQGGLEPGDWYALLNGHVFLWPDRERMERQLAACSGRPQALLSCDTLVPYQVWLRDGWPTGPHSRRPAEVLFRCSIPLEPPFLIDIADV